MGYHLLSTLKSHLGSSIYLKEFGNTTKVMMFNHLDFSANLLFYAAGKESMMKGPGAFNKAASVSYKSLKQTERAQMEEACVMQPLQDLCHPMKR